MRPAASSIADLPPAIRSPVRRRGEAYGNRVTNAKVTLGKSDLPYVAPARCDFWSLASVFVEENASRRRTA